MLFTFDLGAARTGGIASLVKWCVGMAAVRIVSKRDLGTARVQLQVSQLGIACDDCAFSSLSVQDSSNEMPR